MNEPDGGAPAVMEPAGDPRRDPGGPVAAAISWVTIVGLIALLIGLTYLGGRPGAMAAEAEQESAEQDVTPPGGMFSLTTKVMLGASSKAEQAEAMGMMGMFAAGDADELRLALVEAEVNGADAGVKRIDTLLDREVPLPDRIRDDAALFRDILTDGAGSIGEAEREGLVERHGWFATLTLTHDDPDSPLRTAILASARKAYRIQLVMSIGVLGVIVLGVVLFITAIVLIATGVMKRAYAPPSPGGSVFIETFALFLGGFLVLSLIGGFLEPVVGVSALLLNWLALPIALWPLARGLPWAKLKHALGWHAGRGALREIGLGLVGYVACLPIVGLGVLLTLLLSSLFAAEEGAAPTHPLGDMMADASLFEMIVLVQLATVWAPVVEETFFRGALYHHLRGRLHHVLAGLFVGLIFAAIHPQGAYAIPALGSIGFSLSMIREWRGTVLGSVAAHAANNGFIVTLLVLLLSA